SVSNLFTRALGTNSPALVVCEVCLIHNFMLTITAKCGFVIIVMALYWCTECMPLSVTALLPVILFPMLGIMESGEVCVQYLNDSNMLFIGGLLVAIAVEYWNLHKRIAMAVLMVVGVRPALLMMGFMSVTAFLSMWISNTASTAMMLPIAQAVLEQLTSTEAEQDEREVRKAGGISDAAHGIDLDLENRKKAREQKYLLLNKGMSLSVCYSASIGGTATLTGTTPNLILKGQMDHIFPNNSGVINFASWFGFSFPNMLLMLLLSWMWLQCMFLGFNFKKSFGCGSYTEGDHEAYKVIKDEYKKLGRMKFAEGAVLTIFVILVVLWFTRDPGFMPGWAAYFNKDGEFVTDGTVAILMATLFFIIPSQLSRTPRKLKSPPALLVWSVVHERMPWNIILLLGGGFALASGSKVSGLSIWLGESLAPLKTIPPFSISLLLCLLVSTFTECSSNTATTTLFLPILASMATAIELHPLYVMLPCTISASMAFMLPVATPPNAIAFSYGTLKVLDMAKAGFILNMISILCINLGINTWGMAMFHLDTFPSWANVTHMKP
uniref:Solute carrier family 13 member 2 n=1 Tax=Electrophorus electricus TaxID=8005 RepID=A0A4W4GPG3_ELEEL